MEKSKALEFLAKEEARLNGYLEMHLNSAKRLKEDISDIRNIRERLLGQPGCEVAPGDSMVPTSKSHSPHPVENV